MCYPCEHCGACKVHIEPDTCPMCGGSIAGPGAACPDCGFVMPLPPGAVAADMRTESSDSLKDKGKESIMTDKDPKSQENTEEANKAQASGDGNVIPRATKEGYEPEIIVQNDLPLADTFGVVGTWPVATNRPKL